MVSQTQQIQHDRATERGNGLKIALVFIAGVFALYAIQHHLIIDLFSYGMSLIFEHFSVKATGIFPDIALLVLFALLANGTYSLLKNHFPIVLISIIAVFAVMAWRA